MLFFEMNSSQKNMQARSPENLRIYDGDDAEDLSCPNEQDFSGVQPDLELDVNIVDVYREDSSKRFSTPFMGKGRKYGFV